jgi:SAM-dependent methyltransferase
MTPTTNTDDVRRNVRETYGEIARGERVGCGTETRGGSSGCCTPAASPSESLGYSAEELSALPTGADLGLGCGVPGRFAELNDGETVLDLGSGGGIDAFLAAARVGPRGHVIGVDMTADMVERARRNAAKDDVKNVEFRLGEIEHLPVADASVDVILSNCVINLSTDKEAVYREAFRVLKPGGRVAISDVVTYGELPAEIRNDPKHHAACVAGALPIDEVRDILTRVGFDDVHVEAPLPAADDDSWNAKLASASIRGRRPA